MHYVRQEDLPFVGSSHEFVGAEQGDAGVSVFLFHGKPGSGPGPHRHPYDEISSFVKAVVCGQSTARLSRVALETSLLSRLARSTASRPLVIRRWYNSTFTSVPASPRRTCKSSWTLRCFWHGADGNRLKGLVFPSSTDHVIKAAT